MFLAARRMIRRAGIESLRIMTRSVRDFGVESIFTKGSASGDWQQRQHPSDLLHPYKLYSPPAVEHEAYVGGAAAVDPSHNAASSCDEQAQHTAETIALLTASVLRKSGVDEATIADAVRVDKAHSNNRPAAPFTRHRYTAVVPVTKSCCCIS